MSIDASLWIPITIAAAFAQTLRNAAQRRLVADVGTLGATLVRFLYGLPFALVWLAVVRAWQSAAADTPAFVLRRASRTYRRVPCNARLAGKERCEPGAVEIIVLDGAHPRGELRVSLGSDGQTCSVLARASAAFS